MQDSNALATCFEFDSRKRDVIDLILSDQKLHIGHCDEHGYHALYSLKTMNDLDTWNIALHVFYKL